LRGCISIANGIGNIAAVATTNAADVIAIASKSSTRCNIRAYDDETMPFVAALRAEGSATRQSVLCDGSFEVVNCVEASTRVQCTLLWLWLW
jgi:hypothetical protein